MLNYFETMQKIETIKAELQALKGKIDPFSHTLEEATKEYNKNCPFKSQYIREGVLYMD